MNIFTHTMRIPHYIHKIIQKVINKNDNKILLGRWNLKHDQTKLNLFYTQIPDPGYRIDKVETKNK